MWQTIRDHMKEATKFVSGLGCLLAVLALLLAVLLYPRANWLFFFALVGIVIFLLNGLLAKDPTPQALADEIERLLTGEFGGWDVDNFEHLGIRDPQLRELWNKSMKVGGRPEEWVRLDQGQKQQLLEVIRNSENWVKREMPGQDRDALADAGPDLNGWA